MSYYKEFSRIENGRCKKCLILMYHYKEFSKIEDGNSQLNINMLDIENVETNIFPAMGRPSDKVEYLDKYLDSLFEEFEDEVEFFGENLNKKQHEKKSKKLKKKLKTSLSANIKYIYTIIKYPIDKPVYFKFSCRKPVTYGMLLYAHTIAYQRIYDACEKENPYGVWGHDIKDLVYNGLSHIQTTKDSVICYFSVDS